MTVDYDTSNQNGIVREVIRDYFADKGIDIDELVMVRKADRRGKIRADFRLITVFSLRSPVAGRFRSPRQASMPVDGFSV